MNGLGALVRLTLRRNRWFSLAWILAVFSVLPLTASAYENVIDPDHADILIATMENNPTMRAMLGPPFDLHHAGGFAVWRVGTFAVAMAGIMAILGTVRATRAEEEAGRTELLRSGSVGRHAPLTAGVLVSLGVCALLGLLTTVSMIGVDLPVAGSVALGVGLALGGAVWVGVAAVAAQLTGSSRAARSLALWTLAAAYTVRAVADGSARDSTTSDLAWASPVQWMALSRPYAGERWWVLLLPLALAVLLLVAAVALEAQRDHGSGRWAERRGPAHTRMGSADALAGRLHRGGIIGWTIGMLIFALAMGSLSTSFGDMLADTPQLEVIFTRMGGGAEQLAEAFFVAMLGIVSVLMGIWGVMLFHRLEGEEERGHAELLLSTGVSRTRLLRSHLLVAVLAPTLLLTVVGAVMTVNQALATDDWSWVWRVAGAALALAPGGLVVLGLAVLLHGWAPRLSWLVWLLVAWSLFAVWVGPVLDLPDEVLQATPWGPLPQLPVQDMDGPALLGVVALGLALMAVGVVGYRRRDLR